MRFELVTISGNVLPKILPMHWLPKVKRETTQIKRSAYIMERWPDMPPTYTQTKDYIDLDTVEELVRLSNDAGHALVVEEGVIKIYDEYME